MHPHTRITYVFDRVRLCNNGNEKLEEEIDRLLASNLISHTFNIVWLTRDTRELRVTHCQILRIPCASRDYAERIVP